MKDLRNPSRVAAIHRQAEAALEKQDWQGVIDVYEDTVFEGCITVSDAVGYEKLAKAYQGLGKSLSSQIASHQAQLVSGKAIAGGLCEPQEDYYELACRSLVEIKWVEACIYYAAYENEKEGEATRPKDEVKEVIMKEERLRHFYEQVKKGSTYYCIVIGKAENTTLVKALLKLGKRIYKIKMAMTTHQLVEQLEVLSQKYCKAEAWMVLGERLQLQKGVEDMRCYKIMQKLYVEPLPQRDEVLSAFYMGDYLAIAKYMYGFDVAEQLNRTPSVKVSIVIPVKGYTETLGATLATCLNQDSQDFEVVVSDNGSEEDQRIAELIQRIGSEKIKYYRVPYPLPLHKSFEYAYFRARGEFICSIGADDGLLPYAVRYICENMASHPEENVMMWERLFYVWPAFKETGQAGAFTFPVQGKKGQHQLFLVEGKAMLEQLIEGLNQGLNAMYHMPMGYINSGMRRKQIQKIIKQTGKFLDGSSQDVYTGIINLALCERILYEKTPLTIAGMSGRSLGASTVLIQADLKRYKDYIKRYNQTERWTPLPSTPEQQKIFPQFDYTLWVYEFLKVCDLELLGPKEEWLAKIDFPRIYEWMLRDLTRRPKEGIDTIERIVECSYACSQELGDSVTSVVQQKHEAWGCDLEAVERQVGGTKEKLYEKGMNGQQLTIDSEAFGVRDIEEASKFFVKLLDF